MTDHAKARARHVARWARIHAAVAAEYATAQAEYLDALGGPAPAERTAARTYLHALNRLRLAWDLLDRAMSEDLLATRHARVALMGLPDDSAILWELRCMAEEMP